MPTPRFEAAHTRAMGPPWRSRNGILPMRTSGVSLLASQRMSHRDWIGRRCVCLCVCGLREGGREGGRERERESERDSTATPHCTIICSWRCTCAERARGCQLSRGADPCGTVCASPSPEPQELREGRGGKGDPRKHPLWWMQPTGHTHSTRAWSPREPTTDTPHTRPPQATLLVEGLQRKGDGGHKGKFESRRFFNGGRRGAPEERVASVKTLSVVAG